MSTDLESLKKRSARWYRELTELPTYTSAQFQDDNVLRVGTSMHDHVRNSRRANSQTFVIAGDTVIAGIPTEADDVVKSTISPSRAKLAILKEVTDDSSPDGKKRLVEIWEKGKVVAAADVTQTHGSFYGDENLSSLSFSPSEEALVYIAEKKIDDKGKESSLSKYEFVPELGEGYPGKKRPGIFLFRWYRDGQSTSLKTATKEVTLAEQSSTPVIWSQATFAGENQIFAVAYDYTSDGRILGIKFCPNRQASIWEFPLPDATQDNTDETVLRTQAVQRTSKDSPRSPRVHLVNGKPSRLVWLANPVGGPHASCATLHVHDLTSDSSSWQSNVLVDTVVDPEPTAFPGIYTTSLPSDPFLQLGSETFVVLTSSWHSRTTILLVSLKDGSVKDLAPDSTSDHYMYSWATLGADGKNQVIGVRSSPNSPQELLLGKVFEDRTIEWKDLATPELSGELRDGLKDLKTSIIPIPGREAVETILVQSKKAIASSNSQPLLTVIHGGPHGGSVTAFNSLNAVVALNGFTLSYPNYSGSVGYGDKYVRKLIGRIGDLDVKDCIESVNHLIKTGVAKAGPGQQFISGGSHGGFLGTHLIGQYPDVFSGAVIRNPVISVGELSYSDIPDWYYEEASIPFKPTSIVTPDVYEKLFKLSPIAYVDAVKTPVWLAMGEVDLRVATTQIKTYYHALKARGRDVTMFAFPNNAHGLEGVEAGRAQVEAITAFLNKHRS
ncbi:alpha beta-hydrolase [Panus rudis PR-1116 ss-1]|nr:alpha beta-hydrolase [Panus rudis PR-1116 ss-1]